MTDLILKGRGVFLRGQHAEQGRLRAMSPADMEKHVLKGENPFHIDPRTGRLFDESKGYILRDTYTAMVEEMLREIVKANKDQLEGNEEGQENIRKRLRRIVNDSFVKFNQHKGLTRQHNMPEEGAFHTKDALGNPSGEVNPKLLAGRGVYAEKYQKPASLMTNGLWEVNPESKHEYTPSDMLIHNVDGVIPGLHASEGFHNKHGHMSESLFTPTMNIILHDYKRLFPQAKVPWTMVGGSLDPAATVLFQDPRTGKKELVWQYDKSNRTGTDGRHHQSQSSMLHGANRDLLRAILSLHPIFFQTNSKFRGQAGTYSKQRAWATKLLTSEGLTPTAEQVSRLANTPALYMIAQGVDTATQRSSGRASRGGEKSAYNQLMGQLKQAMGVPARFLPGMEGTEQHSKWAEYNNNVSHIGFEPSLGGMRASNLAGDMKEPFYLSMRLSENPELAASLGDMTSGAQNLQVLRRSLSRHKAFHHTEFDWLEPHEIPATEERLAERVHHAPFQGDEVEASKRAQRREAVAGAGGDLFDSTEQFQPQDDTLATSQDSLYDLMESLQSSDARMDPLIIKGLPSQRRFYTSSAEDCDILCKTLDLHRTDLLYISEAVGDWTRIAKELKLEPSVVKVVKVALRW